MSSAVTIATLAFPQVSWSLMGSEQEKGDMDGWHLLLD